MTTDQTPARDRLFALIASIPGSGSVDWCGPARALLDEIAAAGSVPASTARAEISARLMAAAEDRIVAEWICCEPLDPKHKLCAKGYAALEMTRALLVDDPAADVTAAPLLDAVMGLLPAVSVPPPADQTARRQQLADAMREHYLCTNRDEADADGNLPCRCGDWREPGAEVDDENDWDAHLADAVLAVLPEQTDRTAEAERPLSPDYEHPECGFHWHGRDGMDIPIRDGQPVCPRCELAKVEKKLAYVQRMRDEVGAECKRRGRIKLEQAERIVRLERELDGVRDQLGKEMLRADDAETELRRMAAEEQPAETQGTTADKAAALGLTDAEYRARSHAAAVATIRAAIPGMYAHVGFRLEDVLNEAATERPAVGEQPETQHVGGRANAEDCPACSGTNPPYPFLCPGPDAR